MKKLSLLIVLFVFVSGFTLLAQTKVITGTITSAVAGEGPIPGVTIQVKGTSIGTITDADGKYRIDVPSNATTLVFSFVGMKNQEVLIAGKTVIDGILESDIFGLDEVVVTGVPTGTPTKKLGFAMSKVQGDILEAVPAVDASNALRGKVAGVSIVQSQGDGSAEVSIRGAKSIYGNISPLIIVDGILTTQGLGDINTDDIERIEVVKGAAASSLYGSLAAGGVVQIITKRGKERLGLHMELRSEYGVSDIEKKYPAAMEHPFKVNANGSFDMSSGDRQLDTQWHTFAPYYKLYDNVDLILSNQAYKNTNFSLSNSGKEYSLYTSAQYQSKGGVSNLLDPETQLTVRVNTDFFPTQKFTAKISTSYSQISTSPVSRGDQGTFFSSALLIEPFIDLTEKDSDGDYMVNPTGFDIQNANIQNPLYQYNKIEYQRVTQRFVGGIDLKYQLTPELSASISQSFDKSWYYSSTFYPVGYKTQTNNPQLNNGNYAISESRSSYEVTSAQMVYNKTFGTVNLGVVGKYLYEHRLDDAFDANGYSLQTVGVYDLGITGATGRGMGSSQQEYITKNFFLSTDLSYKDKIIANALIREDGSSLFGADARWQTFWRGSLAYRITEDIKIPGFNELKARISYGTAGRRPEWKGQYETFSVTSAGIFARNLGNNNLKPAVNKEIEIGIDGTILDKFTFQISYANSTVKNDFVWRTLSSVTGYTQQYQNLGAVKSSSFEVQIGGNILEKEKFNWDVNLSFDRIRSEITDLGGIPDFTNDLYRVETGQPVGIMYGNAVMTSLSDLQTDDAGYVMNAWNVPYSATVTTNNVLKSAFVVNNVGYVVRESLIGTPQEMAIFYMDMKSGAKELRIIGDRNPSFKIGLSNTFTFFKNLQLYVLLDWKQGGDKYNQTRQYMYFNYRHQDQIDFFNKGHDVLFSTSASSLYNANDFCRAFVEDASYLKVREVALSYSINKLFDKIDRIKFSLVGRNLLTFTKYNSYDPEGYQEYFEYPIFRTYSGSILFSF
jgi:TonB-linked SusC/RagA family outer membrane protein